MHNHVNFIDHNHVTIIHFTYTCIQFILLHDYNCNRFISIQSKSNYSNSIENTTNNSLCIRFTNQNNIGYSYHNQNYKSTSDLNYNCNYCINYTHSYSRYPYYSLSSKTKTNLLHWNVH